MSPMLFVPFGIFLGVRIWRDLRWNGATGEERVIVPAAASAIAVIVAFTMSADWRTGVWLLVGSALVGWFVPEIAEWLLHLLNDSAKHTGNWLRRTLAPLAIPAVACVAYAVLWAADPKDAQLVLALAIKLGVLAFLGWICFHILVPKKKGGK